MAASNSKKSADRFHVTFWGTRGSISTPGDSTKKYGGNTPCVSVRFGETEVIFDAGTGIRNLGLDIAKRIKETAKVAQMHLLLSHTHWDHIQGLPFFEPAYMSAARLSVYGSSKKGRFLESILQGQMDVNYFPVQMNQLAASISIIEISGEDIYIGPINVKWQEQVLHPGGSVRYSLLARGKKIVYATDVELNTIFSGKKTKENAGLESEYRTFIKDADLLIADGQYTGEEYPSKQGYGHTTIPLIVEIAHSQKVKQLAIFHHDPQHSDSMLDKLWKNYAPKYAKLSSPMNIFWAREGMTMVV